MPIPTMPALALTKSVDRRTDVLVLALTEDGLRGVPDPVDKAYAKKYGIDLAAMAQSLGAKSTAGTVRTLPVTAEGQRVLVVGVGSGAPTPEDLRRAAGAGVRESAALADDTKISVTVAVGAEEPETLQAVAEGALLGGYAYAGVTSRPPATGGVEAVSLLTSATLVKSAAQVVADARAVAEAVLVSREWVNIPPNLLYPESFAEEVRGLAKNSRLSVEVWDDAALARDGYGGLLAVGGGSARSPRLVRLSYSPRGARVHLALVGKGITFDSGGLNLKPGDSMYTMKCDMAGAAAVLAATHAIATLGIKVKVTAYAALAENLPSDTAYRPSDVLTIYGGKTVENGNTDAEGRLVMADAIVRAGEDKPDFLVDVATLTGACIVALGDRTVGLMASDDDTADRVLDAAEAAGEDFWQLPIPKEIRPKLDSKVADLRSTSGERGGGALVAAAFLRDFVPEGMSWAHLDIAGPSWNDGAPYGHVSTGGTGSSVRTLVSLARSLAAGKT